MYRILLLIVLLIIHGSLYPWKFHSPSLPASPLLVLLHTWSVPSPTRYIVRDVVVNLALYLPLGVFGFLAMRQHRRKWLAIAGPLWLALALSSSMEMTQLFVVSRTCGLRDLVCNVAGAACGVLLAVAFEEQWSAVSLARNRRLPAGASGALLLICCWAGYQLFPFFPDLSRARFAWKAAAFFAAAPWPGLAVFISFAEWLAVGRLLEALPRIAKPRTIFLALLLLLPGKLLLAGRTLTWPELAGAVLAFLAWRRLQRGAPGRTLAVAALLSLALILYGLAPFHLQKTAAPFFWIPFRALLGTDWQSGFPILLRKSFWYGSAVWLLRQSGWRFTHAAALTSFCLAGIEVLQIHLPGRTPEITDPVMAALLALIFSLLEIHQRSGRPQVSTEGSPGGPPVL